MYDYLSSVFNDFIEQLKSMKRKVASMSEGLTEAVRGDVDKAIEMEDQITRVEERRKETDRLVSEWTERQFEYMFGTRETPRLPSPKEAVESMDWHSKDIDLESDNNPEGIKKAYKIGQWKVDQETEEYVILSKPDRSVKPENKFGLLIVGFIAALFTTWWFIPIPLMLAVGYRYIPHERIIYKK